MLSILFAQDLHTQPVVTHKVFKIGIFGLTAYEQNALSSMFKLAATRERRYHITQLEKQAKADIVLVDLDDPKAVEAWQQFNRQHSGIPTVKVTETVPDITTGDFYLYRPLTLTRVLTTLDTVTISALKYTLVTIDDNQIIDEVTSTMLEEAIQTAPLATHLRALVVDDAIAVRKAMEIQLSVFGITVDFAESGEEALEYVKKQIYDIIFLDIMLPGIDGYTVCKIIKTEKKTAHIPIVLLTSKTRTFDKLKGILAGAKVYLTKPVPPEHFKAIIQQILP